MNEGTGCGTAVRPVRMDLYLFSAPSPVRLVSSFAVMTQRNALLVRLEDADGAWGWGEIWCNYPNCGGVHKVEIIREVIASHVLGKDFSCAAEVSGALSRKTAVMMVQTGEIGPVSHTLAGIDCAVRDLEARRKGVPLYRALNPDRASGASVPVYASGINPDGAAGTIRAKREAGFTAFKIKIGFTPERDIAVVEGALAALEADETLAVDANQAWDAAAAGAMLARLDGYPLQWIEEPVRADSGVAVWERLARSTRHALAAGENLTGETAFADALAAGHLGVIQPDACKWGGVTGCFAVGMQALASGKRFCPHFLGGGIGQMASAHLLAAVGGDGMLEVDANANPLRTSMLRSFPAVADGRMTLPDAPGLGVEPDLEGLSRYLAGQWKVTP